jgi:chromosomal replication initiation ATPase DnaA
VIVGSAGSGKTHLCHVFQQRLLGKAIVFDDVDVSLASGGFDEEALFHAYNRYAETRQPLLLTAQTAPEKWHIKTADMRSRLMAAPTVVVGAPDDQLMAVVIAKMFSDRQIFVPQEVVEFIIRRIERSFAAIGHAVAEIDRAALAQKRAVTVPFVRDILV